MLIRHYLLQINVGWQWNITRPLCYFHFFRRIKCAIMCHPVLDGVSILEAYISLADPILRHTSDTWWQSRLGRQVSKTPDGFESETYDSFFPPIQATTISNFQLGFHSKSMNAFKYDELNCGDLIMLHVGLVLKLYQYQPVSLMYEFSSIIKRIDIFDTR